MVRPGGGRRLALRRQHLTKQPNRDHPRVASASGFPTRILAAYDLARVPMAPITDVERRIPQVESLLILLSIGAIAAADWLLAKDSSLGFLYLVPLSYSALTHRWPVFLGLLALCVGLRQWDTPVQQQGWDRLALDWTLVAVFLGLVVPLRRLGRARALFFRTAREQRDELVRDVEMAAAVQRHLLEQHRPPTGPLDVVARTEPAKVVGGDYYDFVPLSGGRLAVVVADVAGKGLPAALIMPAVKISIRTLAQRHAATSELLAELNRIFLDNLPPASYFTLVYAVFDPDAEHLVYANAGHPPALHLDATRAETDWLTSEGPAVGLLHADVQFHTVERGFAPGDLFVLYTDGITEATDAAGHEFGDARLADTVRRAAGLSARAVVNAVHEAVAAFRGPLARGDDATVIAVRVPPNSAV
jgi:serine phosphatase RsbU (regulator of sigma subunit)